MARSTQTIQREQTRKQIARAASAADRIGRPATGWIHAVRTALGMSGAALSKRLGGGRTMAANLERYEREERVTLRTMRQAAEAMGCRFVYAIVPPESRSIESLIAVQARTRAAETLRDVAVHMSLEGQQLGDEDARAELDRITRELMQHPPRDFWEPDRHDR